MLSSTPMIDRVIFIKSRVNGRFCFFFQIFLRIIFGITRIEYTKVQISVSHTNDRVSYYNYHPDVDANNVKRNFHRLVKSLF
jgi:hypothetical protein